MYNAASMEITPIEIGSISAGALLGTRGSAALIQSINDSMGTAGFFDSMQNTFRDIRASVLTNVIAPLQQTARAVMKVAQTLMNPDMIRPLIAFDDFKSIPPSMYEPIVMYQPVRRLLEQGVINGFGFDPDHLPDEDVWGRLIDNGTVYDVLGSTNKEGQVELKWEFKSTDPNVSFEELDAVEQTRFSIDRMLSETRFDPTDYPEERG